MDLYELIVLLHIAAAVGLLSSSVVASPAVQRAIQRARTLQELRAYLAIGRPLLVFEPASAMVVLASGIYLASAAHFWSLAWVQVAVGSWILNAVVAGTLVKPALGRVASEAAKSPDGPLTPDLEALRSSPRWTIGGDVLAATDASMLYLMTIKPGMAGSLLAVVVAFLVVSGARTGLRSRRMRVAARPASGGQAL